MNNITKKITVMVMVFALTAAFSLASPLPGRQDNEKNQKEENDPLKNISLIDEVQPIPEKFKTGFESITGKDAHSYIRFLSSDLLEGRDTATRGYHIAAEFAAAMFRLWGLKPAGDLPAETGRRGFFAPPQKKKEKKRGYLQAVELKEIVKSDSRITTEYRKGSQFKTRTFQPGVDYEFRPQKNETLSAPVVFAGYGISEKELNYDDYKKLDVKGKIVIILTGTPGKGNSKSPFNNKKYKKKYTPQRRMRMRGSPKVNLAQEKGAAAIIMVESNLEKNPDIPRKTLNARNINDEEPIIPGKRRQLSLIQSSLPIPWMNMPTVRVSRDMADVLLGYAGQTVDKLAAEIEKDYKSHSFALPGVSIKIKSSVEEKLTQCRNVLGYIEGSDPKLKDEVVIIGAHLDHLGKRGDYVFNGADDNGSGSAAVMEIAQAFASNPVKPKRSVLFALWTGEEKGLLGSRYFVNHPFFPLKKIAAYINLDMISRTWSPQRLKMMQKRFGVKMPEEMDKKIDASKFISLSLTESSAAVFDALKKNNKYVGLHILFRPTARAMGGSDHAAFAFLKIPWAAFFAAMTTDYHHPTDTLEKISLPLLEKNARLAWLAAFTLAERAAPTP